MLSRPEDEEASRGSKEMNGITYYTVSYHMQPIAHFRDYGNAVRFATKEREKRLEALEALDPPMLCGEKRGETRSIKYGIAVRRIEIEYNDVDSSGAISFG